MKLFFSRLFFIYLLLSGLNTSYGNELDFSTHSQNSLIASSETDAFIRESLIDIAAKTLDQSLTQEALLSQLEALQKIQPFSKSEFDYLGQVAFRIETTKSSKYSQFINNYRCYSEIWKYATECQEFFNKKNIAHNYNVVTRQNQKSQSDFLPSTSSETKNDEFKNAKLVSNKEVTYFLGFILMAVSYQVLKNKQILITF